MNIRRVEVHTIGGEIVLRLFTGHATQAVPISGTIDPATALVLMGKLEAAVHAVCPDGILETKPQNQS